MSKTYVLNGDLVARKIEGEYYIVDSSNRMLHSMNETGTFIFEQIKKKKKGPEILAALCGEFDVDEKSAEEDLGGFIKILKEKKILV